MRSWRRVVRPNRDVLSGVHDPQRFAPQLWQVHAGEGREEYRDPATFFRQTFLTPGLRELLRYALQSMNWSDGGGIVQILGDAGEGKTHALLALYHLFSDRPTSELSGLEALLGESGAASRPTPTRVVLDGHRLSPAIPDIKPDGTVVRTLWGELAWQLGGRTAYEQLRVSDEEGAPAVDVLKQFLTEYQPILILLDGWLAYFRQLCGQEGLPGGSAESQSLFAMVLLEAVAWSPGGLLAVAVEASEAGRPAPEMQALDWIRHITNKAAFTYRTMTPFELASVVNIRLFEPIVVPDRLLDREAVIEAYLKCYQDAPDDFPLEYIEWVHERALRSAYPWHPLLFSLVCPTWYVIERFEGVRTVLRLMAAVLQSLWEDQEEGLVILAADLPLGDQTVQSVLSEFLPDSLMRILKEEVDGPESLPVRLDRQHSPEGTRAAHLRVARTVFVGSIISPYRFERLDIAQVKIGCASPGDSPSTFEEAAHRLALVARHLHQEGLNFWYSAEPKSDKKERSIS